MYNEDYYKYLLNKKVIVVCPAQYLEGQNKGDWIDSFDVVIRINQSIPIKNTKDYGSRTDVLYTYLTHAHCEYWQDVSKLNGVKWLNVTEYLDEYLNPLQDKLTDTKINTIKKHYLNYLEGDVGCRVFTGIIAMCHLLTTKLNSLHVFGMDMYKTRYCKGYENEPYKMHQGHDIDKHLIYLNRLTKTYNKLIIDDTLKNRIRGVDNEINRHNSCQI